MDTANQAEHTIDAMLQEISQYCATRLQHVELIHLHNMAHMRLWRAYRMGQNDMAEADALTAALIDIATPVRDIPGVRMIYRDDGLTGVGHPA